MTLDLEGVLTPEIWVALGEETGLAALCRTTKDEPDYRKLMASRIEAMSSADVRLSDICRVASGLTPLPGAREFLTELRRHVPVVILSDTFEQTVAPLLAQLDLPLVLCHRLRVVDDRVVDVDLRDSDSKRLAVEAFRSLGYRVSAAGDSYNDLSMLSSADRGFLFRSTPQLEAHHPELPATSDYDQLLGWLLDPPPESAVGS